jgi:hypothetical protein
VSTEAAIPVDVTIDVPEPSAEEVRRYQMDPEFHRRVYSVYGRLRVSFKVIIDTIERVVGTAERRAFEAQLSSLAIRIVVEQELVTP